MLISEYVKTAKDLQYHNEYVERIKKCKTDRECEKVLEYARIRSIDDDMLRDKRSK